MKKGWIKILMMVETEDDCWPAMFIKTVSVLTTVDRKQKTIASINPESIEDAANFITHWKSKINTCPVRTVYMSSNGVCPWKYLSSEGETK